MGVGYFSNGRELEEIEVVALFNDIGKIAVDVFTFDNLGKPSDKERDELKRHPEIGYRILSAHKDFSDIAEYVLYHHERWDGKGYPKGLKEVEIPIQARMIAIADAFDAMTSEKPYRAALSKRAALEEIKQNAGKQFDPELARFFI